MDNLEAAQRISKLEEKADSQNQRIKKLEEKAENIPRLDVLMQMVVETNDKQSETLDKINENLTGLNGEIKNLSSQVSTLGGRVEKLEENEEESKIDLRKLFKQVVFVAVPSLVVAGLVFYFGWK